MEARILNILYFDVYRGKESAKISRHMFNLCSKTTSGRIPLKDLLKFLSLSLWIQVRRGPSMANDSDRGKCANTRILQLVLNV